MLPWWEITLRMVLSVLLGGLVGWEREVQRKPAGLRTLILVSLSSSIYVLAAHQSALSYGEPADVVRAMAGIAQGIGFLGAGAILQSRGEVRWLTTAAALWATAALGFAAGLGMYYIAILGGLLVFMTLKVLVMVEDRWLKPKGKKKQEEPKSKMN